MALGDMTNPSSKAVVKRYRLADVAPLVDQIAVSHALEEYRQRKSEQTKERQKYDIRSFVDYLYEASIDVGDMYNDLSEWEGMSFGLVEGYKQWMLDQGYSVGMINVRLATVRKYCTLAFRAGYITAQAHALIKTVKGFVGEERRNVDEKREVTRIGLKKARPIHITEAEAEMLKEQDDPRDALLMCLLIDHGLRCGEVSGLMIEDFDLEAGELKFYRHKVDDTQTHRLTPQTLVAARDFIDKNATGRLFSGYKQGEYKVRAINARVGELGKKIGLDNLSPHDCRHYWATWALRSGTNIKSLQQAGGWKSPYMPLRYAEDAEIANEGVVLSKNRK